MMIVFPHSGIENRQEMGRDMFKRMNIQGVSVIFTAIARGAEMLERVGLCNKADVFLAELSQHPWGSFLNGLSESA